MNKKIIKYIKNPKLILLKLDKYQIISLSDKSFLELQYYSFFKKQLNLYEPKTFNEKLQWLKIYDRNKKYINMVDKYEVKQYVSHIIGKEYIIPTLGIWKNFYDIDFNKLPNQFVIKTTHYGGSTGVYIIKDKSNMNKNKLKIKIGKILKRNLFYYGREWPYKNVKPRIIIEKYMVDNKEKELRDYKFFCFNGKVKFFKVDFDRFIEHHANYYDTNLNIMPFGELAYLPDYNKKIDFPSNINKMIELAEKLSKDIPFVRVDFYNVNGQIYFGEMTFYPAAGFGKFEPEEWDRKLGDMLELPKQKIEEKNEK